MIIVNRYELRHIKTSLWEAKSSRFRIGLKPSSCCHTATTMTTTMTTTTKTTKTATRHWSDRGGTDPSASVGFPGRVIEIRQCRRIEMKVVVRAYNVFFLCQRWIQQDEWMSHEWAYECCINEWRIHVWKHVWMRVGMHVGMRARMRVRMRVGISIWMHVWMYVWMHVWICMN